MSCCPVSILCMDHRDTTNRIGFWYCTWGGCIFSLWHYCSVLGHEAVAEVVNSKRQFAQLKAGDRIVFSAANSCGNCVVCSIGLPDKCRQCVRVSLRRRTGERRKPKAETMLLRPSDIVQIRANGLDKIILYIKKYTIYKVKKIKRFAISGSTCTCQSL